MLRQAIAVKRTEMAGSGCLVQGFGGLLGLLLCAVFVPLGIVVIFMALIGGSAMARVWCCSACGTKLAVRDVRICPGCRSEMIQK
jgi:hypothetical protein